MVGGWILYPRVAEYGSEASRNPSPKKLKQKTTTMMNRAGARSQSRVGRAGITSAAPAPPENGRHGPLLPPLWP